MATAPKPSVAASMKRARAEEMASSSGGGDTGVPLPSDLPAKILKTALPAENILSHAMIVFAREPADVMQPYPYPELAECSGIYIKIGFLNSKPLFKSQELGSGDLPWSPGKTGFLWWCTKYNHFFLSAVPFDEKESPDFDNWDDLQIKGMFSADLKTSYCPWNAEATDVVKWYSFHSWSVQMLRFTSERLEKFLYQPRVADEEPGEGGDEDNAVPSPATPPGAFAEGGGDAPSASSAVPAPVTMTVGSWTINVPPPPALPSIKKTGYMAKLIAFMVAVDLDLTDRAVNLKHVIMRSFKFKQLYEDHKDMMERTGEDHRFNYE